MIYPHHLFHSTSRQYWVQAPANSDVCVPSRSTKDLDRFFEEHSLFGIGSAGRNQYCRRAHEEG